MGSINSNYVSGILGWDSTKNTQQCYRAGAAGQFNQLFGTGTLAAYALFWISGGIQLPGQSFGPRQSIWGNLDDGASQGWGIYLEPDAVTGQCVLTAGLYAASGLLTSALVLSNQELGGYVERLIVAGLWYDGESLSLSVNGSLQAAGTAGGGPDAYVPSARAATLGASAIPVTGQQAAEDVRIVSAGYAPVPVLNASVGAIAGAHFSACREAYGGAYLGDVGGIDWAHRYEVAQSVAAGTPGAITKSALGPVLSATPIAPASLADIGNAGPTPFAGVVNTPLARVGANDLNIRQIANPDWYSSAGFEFAAPVPP